MSSLRFGSLLTGCACSVAFVSSARAQDTTRYLSGQLSGAYEFCGVNVVVDDSEGDVVLIGDTSITVYGGSISITVPIHSEFTPGANGSHGTSTSAPTPGFPGSSGYDLTLESFSSGECGEAGDIAIDADIILTGAGGGSGGNGRNVSFVNDPCNGVCWFEQAQDGANGGSGGSGGTLTVLSGSSIVVAANLTIDTSGGSGNMGGRGGIGWWGPGHINIGGNGGNGGGSGAPGDIILSTASGASTSTFIEIGAAVTMRAIGGAGGAGESGGSGGQFPGDGGAGRPGASGGSVIIDSSGSVAIEAGTNFDVSGGASGVGGSGGDATLGGCAEAWCTCEFPPIHVNYGSGDGGSGGTPNFIAASGGTLEIHAGTNVIASGVVVNCAGGAGSRAGTPGRSGAEAPCGVSPRCFDGVNGVFGGGGGNGGSVSIIAPSITWTTGVFSGNGGAGGDASNGTDTIAVFGCGGAGCPNGGSGGNGGPGAAGAMISISASVVANVSGTVYVAKGGDGGRGGDGAAYNGIGGAGGLGGGAGGVTVAAPVVIGFAGAPQTPGANGYPGTDGQLCGG